MLTITQNYIILNFIVLFFIIFYIAHKLQGWNDHTRRTPWLSTTERWHLQHVCLTECQLRRHLTCRSALHTSSFFQQLLIWHFSLVPFAHRLSWLVTCDFVILTSLLPSLVNTQCSLKGLNVLRARTAAALKTVRVTNFMKGHIRTNEHYFKCTFSVLYICLSFFLSTVTATLQIVVSALSWQSFVQIQNGCNELIWAELSYSLPPHLFNIIIFVLFFVGI